MLRAAGFELIHIQLICKTEGEVIEHCSDAEALLAQWAPITRRTFQAFCHLKG